MTDKFVLEAAYDGVDFDGKEALLAKHATIEPQRRRLEPYHHSELANLPKRKTLVKGLLDCGAMSVVYGESGCGKTFFALDLAWHIALGWPFFGRKIKSTGSVLYVAAEGGFGIERRLAAIRLHHELEGTDAPLYVYPGEADLLDPDADTRPLIDEAKRLDPPCVLIVGDTLSRVIAGGNENSSDDMGALVRNFDRVRLETGAHGLLVHHSGKDAARGARGHSLLRAATDSEIEVVRDPITKIITATATKQRDVETDKPISFKLASVDLGHDEDGDPITSCVAMPCDAGEAQRQSGPRLSKDEATFLTVLKEAGPAGLHVDEWNDRARSVGLAVRRRQALYDWRMSLKSKRFVHTSGDRWYLTNPSKG